MKGLTCIVCPVGCHLSVDDNLNVTGNRCPRGKKYGVMEMTNPTRMLTTTVKTVFEDMPRLSVKTTDAIPKGLIFEAISILSRIIITNNVKIGDVILSNILDTGVDIVSTKNILKG